MQCECGKSFKKECEDCGKMLWDREFLIWGEESPICRKCYDKQTKKWIQTQEELLRQGRFKEVHSGFLVGRACRKQMEQQFEEGGKSNDL